MLQILKEELNVKDIIFDPSQEMDLSLDTEITPELRKEGIFKEFLRRIQVMRKVQGLNPKDLIELKIEIGREGKEIIEEFREELERVAGIKSINFSNIPDMAEEEIKKITYKALIIK